MPSIRRPDTISDPKIRPATAGDVAAITQIVDDAYRHYIPRMGRRIGYEETGRRTEVGFERVFLRKRLRAISTNVLLPLQK